MRYPLINQSQVPWVNKEQMVEVDRIMEEDLGISLLQMMENAGRGLAQICQSYLTCPKSKILVLAGRGGNGGGAITAGRRLAARGHNVTIYVTTAENQFNGVPKHQLDICRSMSINIIKKLPSTPDDFDVLIDGLIGYSLSGVPKGNAADAIAWINMRSAAKCISLDVPSGFSSEQEKRTVNSVSPDAVATIAAPKKGQHTTYQDSKLFLIDISVPSVTMQTISGQTFEFPEDVIEIEI